MPHSTRPMRTADGTARARRTQPSRERGRPVEARLLPTHRIMNTARNPVTGAGRTGQGPMIRSALRSRDPAAPMRANLSKCACQTGREFTPVTGDRMEVLRRPAAVTSKVLTTHPPVEVASHQGTTNEHRHLGGSTPTLPTSQRVPLPLEVFHAQPTLQRRLRRVRHCSF